MPRILIFLAALSGLSAMIFGAMGAHSIAFFNEAQRASFTTAVNYQLLHTFGVLTIAALLLQGHQSRLLTSTAWAWLLGIVLFSGSIYFKRLSGLGSLGPLTPLGGVFLIGGWLSLGLSAVCGYRQSGASPAKTED